MANLPIGVYYTGFTFVKDKEGILWLTHDDISEKSDREIIKLLEKDIGLLAILDEEKILELEFSYFWGDQEEYTYTGEYKISELYPIAAQQGNLEMMELLESIGLTNSNLIPALKNYKIVEYMLSKFRYAWVDINIAISEAISEDIPRTVELLIEYYKDTFLTYHRKSFYRQAYENNSVKTLLLLLEMFPDDLESEITENVEILKYFLSL
jgi:hypothetical protein